MKTSILITCLVLAFTVAHAGQKAKASSYRKGYAVVTIETQTRGKSGETKSNTQTLCETEVTVPVYEIPEENLEIDLEKNLKNCNVKLGNLDAVAWISPIIVKANASALDSFKTGPFLRSPHWVKESFQKANGNITAYVNTVYLFPKGYDVYSEQEGRDPSVYKDFNQIVEMLGNMAPSQTVAIIDSKQPALMLSTSTDPSLKYCAEHSQESYCSLRYRVKSEVTFKGE
jgi:hypothetical protein